MADVSYVRSPLQDGKWQLVFSDEFNQKNGSRPDTTKWRVPARDGNVRWKRWVSNSPKVTFISNGSLVCRAIPNKWDKSDTAKILTGAVDTRHTYSFKYGKIEARMKTNFKEWNSPAFWLFVATKGKKFRYGEIDIMETFGKKGMVLHTAHTHQTFTLKKKDPKNQFSEELSVTKWHVYGLEWTEDYLRWTVDGKTVGVYHRSDDEQQVAEGQWTFDEPFFILLNQSLFGVSEINTTYETRIDWVRVYQRK